MKLGKIYPAETSNVLTRINPANWDYLIEGPDKLSDVDVIRKMKNVLATYSENGNMVGRKIIKAIYARSLIEGVIATLIWGYPKGRFPGGKGFKRLFESVHDIVAILNLARSRRGSITTTELSREFARIPGIGISTYTKLLYFAEIVTADGLCLIYDQMVMRAISQADDPAVAGVKKKLGDCIYVAKDGTRKYKVYSWSVQEETYGAFLRAAAAIAVRDHLHPADVEQRFFLAAPSGRLD